MTSHRPSYAVAAVFAGLLGGCDPDLLGELIRNPPGGSGGSRPDGAVPAEPVPEGCHCSRGPGPWRSFKCPAGSGASVAALIGPAGGTVTLAGSQGAASGVPLELVIPPGALTDTTKVVVTELSSPPPAGYVDYSPVYRFEPVSLQLHRPAKIRVPWSNMDGSVSSSLAIYWSNDATAPYTPLADNYRNAGFNQASITRFGLAFVGYPLAEDPVHCR